MDDEGNIASSMNLQNSTRTNHNQNHAENPIFTEKYTKLNENSGKKLAPITSNDGTTPRNGKALLPPITNSSRDSLGLDRDKFPRYNQRQEFMPKISTPTGSVAGSVAGSSIRSDMSRTRYEAESPDELALVRAASTYNCCLRGRSAKSVTVWLPGWYTEDFLFDLSLLFSLCEISSNLWVIKNAFINGNILGISNTHIHFLFCLISLFVSMKQICNLDYMITGCKFIPIIYIIFRYYHAPTSIMYYFV